MICEKCGQKTAVMHMTKYINGNLVEVHLCGDCAKKSGLGGPISFQDLFQGLISLAGGMPEKGESRQEAEESIKCPHCGLTIDGFRQSGKLGCYACYETFKPKLDAMLRSMHGSTVHRGKIPKRSGSALLAKREQEQLRAKLKRAIEAEEFEEAATLRDKIRALEKEGEADGKMV